MSPVGEARDDYKLPCRVGGVSRPFENTEKLFPAYSPKISLVPVMFWSFAYSRG